MRGFTMDTHSTRSDCEILAQRRWCSSRKEAMIADHKIRHFVMEVRSNQAAFVDWIVRVGYMYSNRAKTR